MVPGRRTVLIREADRVEWRENKVLPADTGGPSTEDVVPIVERRRQQLDGGVKSDHGSSHVLTCEIPIEAAPDATALVKELGDPSGIGSGA